MCETNSILTKVESNLMQNMAQKIKLENFLTEKFFFKKGMNKVLKLRLCFENLLNNI
jgi:hypothetical protein